MKDGFIKVAALSPELTVADTDFNTKAIKKYIDRANDDLVNLAVFPELCITGYTCSDLFFSEVLLKNALRALLDITKYTNDKYPVCIVGLPYKFRSQLYNCAAVIKGGEILGLVPKVNIPNYAEFYEKRQFSSGSDFAESCKLVSIGDNLIPIGNNMVFCCSEFENYTFGIEICEDLWAADPPSRKLCQSGASIICNLSASNEVIGKDDYRRLLVKSTSARFFCGYIYASAGTDESTTDLVYSRHNIIAENGSILIENKPFDDNKYIVSEIDVNRLSAERHKNTTFQSFCGCFDSERKYFSQKTNQTVLTRKIDKNPFVPPVDSLVKERAEAILRIQSYGLKKRIEHTHAKSVVVGVSGGLDSSLALLVAVRAMDILGNDRKNIIAVTMPCFGTSHRTKNNAVSLCDELGVTLRDVSIADSVRKHFEDIGHDENNRNIVYENCQARERTQVLMDIANQVNGLVVGTGDLSELSLGWATYNGDHMSMYGVNASVPKTLVRYIVRCEADNYTQKIKDILYDILATPVSPELLPTDEKGNINQVTEDLVGPYELHDFFLYYMVRYGYGPEKIFRLAVYSFKDDYPKDVILKWLRIFVKRFFAQQFKRSCLPDGPKVGSVSLSPRGDWRMPSDASAKIWINEVDSIQAD